MNDARKAVMEALLRKKTPQKRMGVDGSLVPVKDKRMQPPPLVGGVRG